jgi:hypothetical protein
MSTDFAKMKRIEHRLKMLGARVGSSPLKETLID